MIANLTQHAATPEQIAAGVQDMERASLAKLLTFSALPDARLIEQRARCVARMAQEAGAASAMIGGAPYLMAPLERELRKVGIVPLYSFSVRESIEHVGTDGGVTKTSVFKHGGWVEV